MYVYGNACTYVPSESLHVSTLVRTCAICTPIGHLQPHNHLDAVGPAMESNDRIIDEGQLLEKDVAIVAAFMISTIKYLHR